MSVRDEYDIVLCKCPICGKKRKISLDKGTEKRYTYCMNCRNTVCWEKIKEK